MTSSLLQNTQKSMDLDDRIVTPPKSIPLKPESAEDAQNSLYACFNPSALSLLAPQLLANQTAAAAALMATWPIQLRAQLASSIGLPAHTPFFPPGWPMTPPLSHKSGNSPPPPTSPLSPKTKFLNHNNNNCNAYNNNIVSTTTASVIQQKKKKRKATASPSNEKSTVLPPGSISPPTSSSSPGSIDTTTVTATPPRDPTKDKVFTCKVCSRSFGYKHVLQNHERTHTGEKPFECSECHKRFTRDHHLKTHMRLHTGEKPYSCSHCDRQFVQVANLRRHLRVHTGERPYTCEICDARFSDSNQLKAHHLVHSDERPFECEKCGGKFRRRHHLVHHKCGDVRSVSSVGESDESAKFADAPLNLSATDGRLMSSFMKRFNESQARSMMTVPQINFIRTDLPEQTEPEDLSMHSPKSPVSELEELEELDDAATLYARLQCHAKTKTVRDCL